MMLGNRIIIKPSKNTGEKTSSSFVLTNKFHAEWIDMQGTTVLHNKKVQPRINPKSGNQKTRLVSEILGTKICDTENKIVEIKIIVISCFDDNSSFILMPSI